MCTYHIVSRVFGNNTLVKYFFFVYYYLSNKFVFKYYIICARCVTTLSNRINKVRVLSVHTQYLDNFFLDTISQSTETLKS